VKSNIKVLTKSKHGLVSGTLRGFADYYGLNLNRLQFVFLLAALFGVGFVLYFALWISIPNYSQKETLLNDLHSKQRQD
jgi:phage shock protein PspC (stress-responsive transcriptional regulator)